MPVAGTIDSELIFLMNKWGVAPDPAYQDTIPDGDGTWSGANSQNVEVPLYPIGAVIQCYNDGSVAGQSGPYEMIYLRAEEAIAAVKYLCVPGADDDHFSVTDNISNALDATNVKVGIAVAAMTSQYYGWFWCGGVCPEAIESDMGGDYTTNASLEIGPMEALDEGSGVIIGFTASTMAACGFSYSTDA